MRVLIVDDERNIRKTLAVCLQGLGCEVTESGTPVSALEALQRSPYDVAFVDLREQYPRLAAEARQRRQQPLGDFRLLAHVDHIERDVHRAAPVQALRPVRLPRDGHLGGRECGDVVAGGRGHLALDQPAVHGVGAERQRLAWLDATRRGEEVEVEVEDADVESGHPWGSGR